MQSLAQLSDGYSLRARVYPALLTILPTVLLVIAWFPGLLGETGGVLGSIAITFGAVYGLSVLARVNGKRAEKWLLCRWGGWPSTIWLRHSSTYLAPATRHRYHQFLATNIPGWNLPTEADEQTDSTAADQAFSSACDWLRAQCRGVGHELLLKENTEYGYRRNLYGLRPYGLSLTILGVAAGLASFLFFEELDAWVVVAAGANLVPLWLWIFVVKETWVRQAADEYARALLAACDSLQPKSRVAQ